MSRDDLLNNVLDSEFHLVKSSMRQQTNAIARENLTISQFRALILARTHDHCAMTDVAEFIDAKPNVATGVVQRLVDKGLLQRTEDPEDRRVRLLLLTDAGREFMDEVIGAVRQDRRVQLEALSDTQLEQLADITATMLIAEHGGVMPDAASHASHRVS